MFEIDMEAIEPVGEFGSRAWCDACASYGVKILEAADLPGDLNWGFSELYTYPPDRLISEDWSQSGYHFMVMNGVVSGGASVPQTCLDQEGFHAKIRWAYICNQSATKYGSAGQRKRSEQEAVLLSQLTDFLGFTPEMGGVPNAVWPAPIVKALSVGVEEGAGLHNIAASLQSPSPEFIGLPTTDMGVPDFSSMSDKQRSEFLKLCGLQE